MILSVLWMHTRGWALVLAMKASWGVPLPLISNVFLKQECGQYLSIISLIVLPSSELYSSKSPISCAQQLSKDLNFESSQNFRYLNFESEKL